MLEIKKKYDNGTVLVQSQPNRRSTVDFKNQFILDYEDFLLLKDDHFYLHKNGSFITRRGEKQYNLNRWLAAKRGYFDLEHFPKITVKHIDSDKANFSKNNMMFYFNDYCEFFHEPQFLPRGVFFNREKEYFYVTAVVLDRLIKYPRTFQEEYQAILFFRRQMMELKRDMYTRWI